MKNFNENEEDNSIEALIKKLKGVAEEGNANFEVCVVGKDTPPKEVLDLLKMLQGKPKEEEPKEEPRAKRSVKIVPDMNGMDELEKFLNSLRKAGANIPTLEELKKEKKIKEYQDVLTIASSILTGAKENNMDGMTITVQMMKMLSAELLLMGISHTSDKRDALDGIMDQFENEFNGEDGEVISEQTLVDFSLGDRIFGLLKSNKTLSYTDRVIALTAALSNTHKDYLLNDKE